MNTKSTATRRLFPAVAASVTSLVWALTGTLVVPGEAHALTCGTNNGYVCQGTQTQYAGSFSPGVGYGGFGGGACTATKTPVIFIHGNGDNAISLDMQPGNVSGYGTPARSVYAELKAQGYNDCELFGVTYLSSSEQGSAQYNYHSSTKYSILKTFIDKVKAYTGKTQVDIVAHSMGVSMALATLQYNNNWSSVRKFVNIGGGIRGLYSCYYTGYANSMAPTCGSQNYFNSYTFGFFPEGWYYGVWVSNSWTGSGSTKSMRDMPGNHTSVSFYTLSAGFKDQIGCATASFWAGCDLTAKFASTTSNVKAQINVGAGSNATQADYDWADGMPYNAGGGDTTNGVGHFRSKTNTGAIIQRMLLTTCTGLDCAATYTTGPTVAY
ncbi:lipase/acyltransferase domain-containing protein [Noviherbaspirillum sedimenti]|uniref:Lipase n=1 Tax=Noviherbaspirillum sedimenti TaxID=2320865 RepID=A0A3A3G7X6_9BURK|nr:lipase [Noviherbaspirillum sedimenti]RJG03914.1 lipase [Noviherbaspirillum sedimenti]